MAEGERDEITPFSSILNLKGLVLSMKPQGKECLISWVSIKKVPK